MDRSLLSGSDKQVGGRDRFKSVVFHDRGGTDLFLHEILRVSSGKERQEKDGVRVTADLVGAPRKENDGERRFFLQRDNRLVQMVLECETRSDQNRVGARLFEQGRPPNTFGRRGSLLVDQGEKERSPGKPFLR